MLAVTAAMMLVTLALPYSPLAGVLGFTPLPFSSLVVIFAIVLAYFVSAEFAKRWFYQHWG